MNLISAEISIIEEIETIDFSYTKPICFNKNR